MAQQAHKKILALTMIGPWGALAHWQAGAAHDTFEPAMSPQGTFTGKMVQARLETAANTNHIPFSIFDASRHLDIGNVFMLSALQA